MIYDVIVIGGGASGMIAAIFAARRGLATAIIEHKERLGKKILATGNGKCNYTNLYQAQECYRGTNPKFAMDVLRQFDQDSTIAFFRSLGVEPKIRNGYVYPNSEQASSVTDVLSMELKRLKVKVALSNHIESIKKKADLFYISTGSYEYEAYSVILATGGCAFSIQGSDGSGYALAKQLGHHIIEPLPALVQLKSNNMTKSIAGVRIDAKGSLVVNQNTISSETGEFLFTEYGISGIPVFQMSRFATDALRQNKKVVLYLDFFWNKSKEDLMELLLDRIKQNPNKTIDEFLIGLINQKFSMELIRFLPCNGKNKIYDVKDIILDPLVDLLKNYSLVITGSNGFDQAQVSAGGVDTNEISQDTMESKCTRGAYLIGELVDVDGTCGGYNLQWAWSSGAVAGMNVRKSEREKI